mmetsp:Transcript_56373/g.132184  ORF Transcript_56373/g.132184 Transcript_56373/m.132184 type:complete len:120 (+) Transcript_56373:880-1239(+)
MEGWESRGVFSRALDVVCSIGGLPCSWDSASSEDAGGLRGGVGAGEFAARRELTARCGTPHCDVMLGLRLRTVRAVSHLPLGEKTMLLLTAAAVDPIRASLRVCASAGPLEGDLPPDGK